MKVQSNQEVSDIVEKYIRERKLEGKKIADVLRDYELPSGGRLFGVV